VTLRTTAIIAGVLGLLMLVTGLIGNAVRADREALTQQALDTPIVVLSPEVLALPGLEQIRVTGTGTLDQVTARPVDADEWLKSRTATYVLGYDGWDELATRHQTRVTIPSQSPQPSASPETSAEATTQASPSAEPSSDPGLATDSSSEGIGDAARDVWRTHKATQSSVVISGDALAVGETVLVFSHDGQSLTSIEFLAQREVNDEWIAPLIGVGGALAVVGVIAVLSALIDIRPLQARIESWQQRRSGIAAQPPRPGSRRERRLAGSTLPAVDLAERDAEDFHPDPAQSGPAHPDPAQSDSSTGGSL